MVKIVGEPLVLENIYSHHGEVGHEVTFVSDVVFPPHAYVQRGPIEFCEDNGQQCLARWFDISQLDCGGLELYPNGLKSQLQKRSKPA